MKTKLVYVELIAVLAYYVLIGCSSNQKQENQANRILTNPELLQQLTDVVGKDGIELWINVYCTDADISDADMALFKKTDNMIQDNYKDSKNQYDDTWEFHDWVAKNCGEYNAQKDWVYKQNSESQPQIQTVQNNENKDFSETTYSDDFVEKYMVSAENIKTDGDRYMISSYKYFLRYTAAYLQAYVYDCDYMKFKGIANNTWGDTNEALQFVSYDCKKDFEVKIKECLDKINQVEKTKRL